MKRSGSVCVCLGPKLVGFWGQTAAAFGNSTSRVQTLRTPLSTLHYPLLQKYSAILFGVTPPRRHLNMNEVNLVYKGLGADFTAEIDPAFLKILLVPFPLTMFVLYKLEMAKKRISKVPVSLTG